MRLCVACQENEDREAVQNAGYNRRGSKDSQLALKWGHSSIPSKRGRT